MSHNRKVVFFNNYYHGGGAENVIKDIAAGLNSKYNFHYCYHDIHGEKVTISNHHHKIFSIPFSIFKALGKLKKGPTFSLEISNAKRTSINLRKFYTNNDLLIFIQLIYIIWRIKPDIIHCHNINTFTMSPYIVAKMFNVPIVTSMHGYWTICPNTNLLKFSDQEICLVNNWNLCNIYCSNKYLSPKNNMIGIKRILEKNSTRIITVSNFVRKRMLDFDYKTVITTIHNGIDLDRFKKTDDKYEDYVLHIGRISDLKGSHIVLKAARKLYELKGKTIKFIFLGSKKPNGLEIPPNCQFIDWVQPNETIKYYCNALTIVAPSIWPEPHSLVPLESMACKTPPIVTNVGGNSESIVDGKTGFLINLDKDIVDKIVNKIIFLYENPEIRLRMGEDAREHVEKYFSRLRMINDYDKVYETILKR